MTVLPRRLRARGGGAGPRLRPPRRLAPLALALVALASAACTETLDTSAACPALCPNQDVTLRDTTIDAVVLDTTLSNFPAKGAEDVLLVASHGAALDTRAVLRFDTLPRTFNRSATEINVPITSLTTARVRFSVDTGGSVLSAPVTVSLYDVDTPELDPTDAASLALFTEDRLLGSRTLASKAEIGDTLRVSLDPAKVGAKVSGGQRLRLGVRVSSAAPVELRLIATTTSAPGSAPVLTVDPTDSTDAVVPLATGTSSAASAASPTLQFNARDYLLVAAGQQPVPSDALVVGGLPARRVYMRFDIPAALLDSATIVRASLLLTQRPSAGVNPTTGVPLVPMISLAGRDITDLARAALVVAGPETISGLASVTLNPGEQGLRIVELASIIPGWRSDIYDVNPRAIVLRVGGEGFVPGELRFYSTEATDPTVRPRLRINYVPRVTFGVP